MTLADILQHLKANDQDRLFLADAIAGAEADAVANDEDDGETSWDEILLAAIDNLLATPAGTGSASSYRT